MSLSRSATTVTIAACASTSPRLRKGMLGPLRGLDPTPRFALRQRTIPVRLRHHTIAGPHIAPYQAQAGVAVGIHRDHRLRTRLGTQFLLAANRTRSEERRV